MLVERTCFTKKQMIITSLLNNRTLVTESDGRMWHTREPAIWYMPKHKWYNVICMIRKTGVYYYCNILSPTLYDWRSFKNILIMI